MNSSTRTAPHQPPASLWAAAPALGALCLTMLVEMVDNSILNVALPTIGRDLEVGATGLQWIVGAYSLTFGGLLMIGGTLGDLLGRRRMLLWGLAGFGASSLLVLFAHSAWQVIAVRALCGVFAALIAPGTMSLLFRLFVDETLRRRAIGLIVTVAMVGFAIGPPLGGLAVEHLSWQMLLVVNAPIALVAWWGVHRGIAPDEAADLRAMRPDVAGAVLSVLTISSGLLTLTSAVEHGWIAWPTVLAAAVAVASGVGFVARERRVADPMLDLSLLSQPAVRGSAVLQTAVMLVMVGVMFAATQLFQFAWGWSPMVSGLATVPMVAGMLAGAPLTDVLVERAGHRRAALAGCALLVGALVLCLVCLAHYPGFAVGMFLMAMGSRLVMTTCAVALIEALPDDHTGIGAAMNDTSQELGNAVGVAIVGTVTAAVMGAMPRGEWSESVIAEFERSQRIGFAILAGLVTVIAVVGGRALTDSRTIEEHQG